MTLINMIGTSLLNAANDESAEPTRNTLAGIAEKNDVKELEQKVRKS